LAIILTKFHEELKQETLVKISKLRKTSKVAREFLSYAGYGLYVGKKSRIGNKQEK
jgi:hypothetical protein